MGGICGIVGPLAALGLVFAATALDPSFRWDSNALSDLGVGPAAAWFNGAVILGGLLTIPFALGLREALPRSAVTLVGSAIFVVGGIALALVGVFTLDAPALHAAAALGYFLLVPIGIVLLAIVLEGVWRWFAILAGVVALASILLLPVALTDVGFAVPEIIEAIVLAAWIAVMGARLVRLPMAAPGSTPRPA